MPGRLKVIALIGVMFLVVAAAAVALAMMAAGTKRRAGAGALARAVVLEARPGATVLQPGHVRVRFATGSGARVEAEIATTIEPHLVPGAEVPVAYDPADPRTVRFAGDAAVFNENAVGKLAFAAAASAALGLLLLATSRSRRLQRLLKVPQ